MSAFKLFSVVAVIGAVVSSTACKKGETTDKSVDTTVTSTKVRDTTVVKTDTTVHTDTVKKTNNAPKP
jgi:hypothetical protein